MSAANPGEFISRMICPFQGKRLSEVPLDELKRWLDTVTPKHERSGRRFDGQAETLRAVRAFLRGVEKRSDKYWQRLACAIDSSGGGPVIHE